MSGKITEQELSESLKNLTMIRDPNDTNKKYKWVYENGMLGIEEVID